MMKIKEQIALVLLCIRQSYALTQSRIGYQIHSNFKYRRNSHVLNLNTAGLNNVFRINSDVKRARDRSSHQSFKRNFSSKHGTPGFSSLHYGANAKIEKMPDNSGSIASTPSTDEKLLDINGKEDKKKRAKRRANRMKVSLALSSMLSAFFVLIYISGPGQWRYYLAGGMCAAISHAITTPVDVIKVCMHVHLFLIDYLCLQICIQCIFIQMYYFYRP